MRGDLEARSRPGGAAPVAGLEQAASTVFRRCEVHRARRAATYRSAIATMALMALLAGCAAKIQGTVQLVDAHQQPVAKDSLQGTVVNMINTTAAVEQASYAATTDANGKYESAKGRLRPGTYKVEASRIGYETETQTVEIKEHTQKKIEFKLRRIQEGKRKTIQGSKSDEDKIINPGEVNIQAPTM